MLFDHFLQLCHIILVGNLAHGNHLFVHSHIQVVIFIQHICDTAAHTCRKVLTSTTKYYDTSTCHVLAAMIANALYNCNRTGVSDTETFSCNTVDKCLTACRTIQCHVTNNDILILFKAASLWRIYDQLTT